MIEPLESRELFSATLATADAAPEPGKLLFAFCVEDLDGRVRPGGAVATEKLVVVHEGFEIR